MATFQMTNPQGRTATPPGVGDGKSLKCVTASYSLAAALALNDVLQSPLIQSGSTVIDVMVVVSDLDTGGSPSITLDVGYGDDPDYFIAASTVGQAGGVARASAATAQPLTLAKNDTIDITVKAAPATGATTGTITLSVFLLPRNG